MHKRFLATAVVALALVLGQGGSFLVAALCPHLRSNQESCETPTTDAGENHPDMGHMQMDSSDSDTPESSDAIVIGKPVGSCSHCAVHSRKNGNTGSLQRSSIPQRTSDQTISVEPIPANPVSVSRTKIVASRAHGPPGDATPRHILINIFRI